MLSNLAKVVITTVVIVVIAGQQHKKVLASKKAKATYKPSAGPDVVGAADLFSTFCN